MSFFASVQRFRKCSDKNLENHFFGCYTVCSASMKVNQVVGQLKRLTLEFSGKGLLSD